MSYDLMVFEPDAAPTDRADFMAWYARQTEWAEPHGYQDPTTTTPRLRAWYDAMIGDYPDMNKVDDDDDFDNPKITDYSIGQSVIYIAFRWSVAEDAYQAVRQLAGKHLVGFFDVSSDEGEVWLPPAGRATGKGLWQRLLGR
ncbi:hypothetical protein [Sphingomonas sp.]|uniref:hypothetical protein n=1 Tax=Sphingomonas sp. TaxID=28214 RepID=UPI003D6D7A9E